MRLSDVKIRPGLPGIPGWIAWSVMALTLLAETPPRFWVGDILEHFRYQYALIFAGLTVWFLINRRYLLTIMTLAGIALNLSPFFHLYHTPGVLDDAVAGSAKGEISVLQWNLLRGNQEIGTIQSYIRQQQPDIVALQELTPDLESGLRPLLESFPHRRLVPLKGTEGMGLLSRFPIVEARVLALTDPENPLIEATLSISGHLVRILVVHPPPPFSPAHTAERIEQFVYMGRWLRGQQQAAMLVGDFNATPWSGLYRMVLADPLNDSIRGAGWQWSWPAKGWLPLFRIPIDHILYNSGLRLLTRRTGPAGLGSDHLPVIARFRIARPEEWSGPAAPRKNRG